MTTHIGYCESCGWPVAPEGVTLSGSDAEPRDGAEPTRCDDSACTTAGKRAVHGWIGVASYVSTFPADDGDGACDVSVAIGEADGGWYIRTSDDAGGGDDAPDTWYASEDDARSAAESFAAERDEADDDEDAQEYLTRMRDEEIAAGEDPEGEIRIVSSQDGTAWDAPRFCHRRAAEKWIARWYADVQSANPGTAILWHLMDCPQIADRETA